MMYTNENLKIISVDGVTPTVVTISEGSYPFINEFYLVKSRDARSMGYTFLYEWMLSDDAKQLLIDCGYVPTNR